VSPSIGRVHWDVDLTINSTRPGVGDGEGSLVVDLCPLAEQQPLSIQSLRHILRSHFPSGGFEHCGAAHWPALPDGVENSSSEGIGRVLELAAGRFRVWGPKGSGSKCGGERFVGDTSVQYC
jgi:hypothetical protein